MHSASGRPTESAAVCRRVSLYGSRATAGVHSITPRPNPGLRRDTQEEHGGRQKVRVGLQGAYPLRHHELPIAIRVTAGNVHDGKSVTPLLAQARYTYGRFLPDYVICDSAYSDKKLRKVIKEQYWATPIIDLNPSHKRAVAKTPKTPEWRMIYNRRTAIESLNGRLKSHRKLNAVRVRGCMKVRNHVQLSTIVCQALALATESRDLVRKVA